MAEFHRHIRIEEDGELATFRRNPNAVFAPKEIDLRVVILAESIVLDEAVTLTLIALRCRGHRASLEMGNHNGPSTFFVAERVKVVVLREKIRVFLERIFSHLFQKLLSQT